jgi:quercetin dioxygenase-like cupin family protein
MTNPTFIRGKSLPFRQFIEGSELRIILDAENGASHFSMGLVTFEPGRQTTPHTRAVEEVVYVLRGISSVVTTHFGEFTLAPGDALHIPPGVEHYHANKGKDLVEQIYLFSPQGPEKPFRDLPIIRSGE